MANGASYQEAMKVFWPHFNKKFPQQDIIVKPTKTGLVLAGRGPVDWHVVAVKLKAEELEMTQALRERLVTAL